MQANSNDLLAYTYMHAAKVFIMNLRLLWSCDGLMVSVLISRSSAPGSIPGKGYCVVFLNKLSAIQANMSNIEAYLSAFQAYFCSAVCKCHTPTTREGHCDTTVSNFQNIHRGTPKQNAC